MALYQPTNITPSLTGALGSGVVDITEGITVSWQVNGNSPMTAFQIVIYENDAASTQRYTTGKRTDNCPFYNMTTPSNRETSKEIFFSYTIPQSALPSNMQNGKEYKLIITQWWDTPSSGSVTQSSASVFQTQETPRLYISPVPDEIEAREYTFFVDVSTEDAGAGTSGAAYTLNFIEWHVMNETGNVIYNTGKLYSTSNLRFTYDGFFTGEKYSVQCFGETSNGVAVKSEAVTFSVSYDTIEDKSALTASCVKSGVKVAWSGLVHIPVQPGTTATVEDGVLKLPFFPPDRSTFASWETVNNEPMNFDVPWTMIWKAKVGLHALPSARALYSADSLNYIAASYNSAMREVEVRNRMNSSTQTLAAFGGIEYGIPTKELATATSGYDIVRQFEYSDGLWLAGTFGRDASGLYYSLNGTEWRKSELDAGDVHSIAHANGLWQVACDNGLFYSADGLNFLTQVGTSTGIEDVMNYGGVWIGGGRNSHGLWRSTDGINWENVFYQQGNSAAPCDYANGMWVATGGYRDLIISRDNGITWSVPSNTGLARVSPNDISCLNNLWICATAANGLYYSEDGVHYEASNVTTGSYRSARYEEGYYVAYGSAGIMVSADGKVWEAVTLDADSAGVMNIDYHNGRWCATDLNGSLYECREKGKPTNWKRFFKEANVGNRGFWSVSYVGGLWLYGSCYGIYAQTVDETQSINPGDIVTLMITPRAAYCQVEKNINYLAPSENLYPSSETYPSDGQKRILTFTKPIAIQQEPIVRLMLWGEQECYYLQLLRGEPANYADWFTAGYEPRFDSNTYFLADFNDGTLQAGNSDVNIEAVGYSIYRRANDDESIKHIADTDHHVNSIYDYGVQNQGGEYTYYLFAKGSDTYETTPLTSNTVNPLTWEWTLLRCGENGQNTYTVKAKYSFGKNLTSGSISNNNTPSILNNFTRYPKVQSAPQNYRSGTLQSLIGAVGFNAYGRYVYADSIALRDAIYELSTTTDTLFLKNRKGDIMKVRISEAITMTTADGTREQVQEMSLPWAEVGDASNVSIIALEEVKDMESGADSVLGAGSGVTGSVPQKFLPLTGGTLTGSVTFEAGADMAGNPITSVGTPTESSDAANRQYVDSEIKEAQPLIFQNVTVQAVDFKADSTYKEYPYAAVVKTPGVTVNDIPEVIFVVKDVSENNFASVCNSVNGGIVIYAREVPQGAVTIPTIIAYKTV